MSKKVFSKIAAFFSGRAPIGVDQTGNRYFVRTEKVDGIMKEKRWVLFKGEQDPTSIPVEWICWLNGQRKKAPTHEEMIELEAMRERVRQNVALLKKEDEERRSKEGSYRKNVSNEKVGGPDLKSFIRQFPAASDADKVEEPSDSMGDRSSEPTGSGGSYRPGTWQPPS